MIIILFLALREEKIQSNEECFYFAIVLVWEWMNEWMTLYIEMKEEMIRKILKNDLFEMKKYVVDDVIDVDKELYVDSYRVK